MKVNVVVIVGHVLKLYGCGEMICDLPRSPSNLLLTYRVDGG